MNKEENQKNNNIDNKIGKEEVINKENETLKNSGEGKNFGLKKEKVQIEKKKY